MPSITIEVSQLRTIMREIIQTEITILIKKFENNKNSDILLRKQAAAYLKIDVSTLHRMTEKKLLKKHGVGTRRVYYLKSEIDAAIIPRQEP